MAEMKANMQLSEGESSTIMALHEYCKNEISQGRSSYIYYIHSKGGCCVRGMLYQYLLYHTSIMI